MPRNVLFVLYSGEKSWFSTHLKILKIRDLMRIVLVIAEGGITDFKHSLFLILSNTLPFLSFAVFSPLNPLQYVFSLFNNSQYTPLSILHSILPFQTFTVLSPFNPSQYSPLSNLHSILPFQTFTVFSLFNPLQYSSLLILPRALPFNP